MKLPKPRRPVLYFVGGGLNERKMFYYKVSCPYQVIYVDGTGMEVTSHRNYPVVAKVELDGGSYVTRQMDRYLLFRDLNTPVAEDALFLPATTSAEFAQVLKKSRAGRCIMHVSPCMAPGQGISPFFAYTPDCAEQGHCVYLFFEREGTGFALHLDARFGRWWPRLKSDATVTEFWQIRHERVEFRWDDLLSVTPDVLSAPVSELRGLCEELFKTRINPKLHAPYTYPEDRQEIPLAWETGSEQELRTLTRAICHTEPDLFTDQQPVTAVYRATTPHRRGGFLFLERKGGYGQNNQHIVNARLVALCELTFRLNPFVGYRWMEHYGPRGNKKRAAERVRVIVEPPSAHDKAEALLTLVDWLDAKLYNTEKRAKFGLPPRPIEDTKE